MSCLRRYEPAQPIFTVDRLAHYLDSGKIVSSPECAMSKTRPKKAKRRTSHRRQSKEPRKYHHGDLRRAFVEASIALIAEQGVSSLSLRAVARRVGVSHAAFHHHFSKKTELLSAVAMEGFEAMAADVIEATAEIEDPWARLNAMGTVYLRFAVTHPAHFRIMYGRELAEGPRRPSDDLWWTNPLAQILVDTTRDALAASGTTDEDSVQTAAIAAWSLIHGLAMLWLDGPLRPPECAETDGEELETIARAISKFLTAAIAKGAGT